MFEQKTTLNIVLTIDVIKAKILYAKTIEELNQAKKELEDFTNQVWFRKDEIMKRLKFIAKTDCWNIRDKVNLLIKELDGSLAPPVVIDGRGGSKHRNVGLKAETEKCNVIARETPSVSAENIKDEEKKDEVM